MRPSITLHFGEIGYTVYRGGSVNVVLHEAGKDWAQAQACIYLEATMQTVETLRALADELEHEINPCEACGGSGEVNPSWNNDPQQARDCSACGATGVAV